ncbi:MAG: periplasmic heavy metal sensor [Acidobacteria bacterium]|nr:periplasmic heavy metal sensor [Acidobacteriota bacterium]
MKPAVSRTIWLNLATLILLLTQAAVAQNLARGLNGQARNHQTRPGFVSRTEAKPETRPEKKVQVEAVKMIDPAKQTKVADFFSADEQQLARLGVGNPVAQMLVFRELQRRFPLSDKQRAAILALFKEETPRLRTLREQRGKQEHALEEAIYGESFDPQAIDQLVNESAATQKELMTRQATLEARLLGILAVENRGQARLFLALYEQALGPQRNSPPLPMLLNRQYNGPWRVLAELFGDDLEMLIPGFGNPLTILLVLRQLELAPAQKAEFKALSQEVRNELRTEFEQRNAAAREQPGREPLAERLENKLKIVEENADRQARLMKRQTHVETRFRQILNPKQWETYTTLLRGMLVGNVVRPAAPPVNQPLLKNRPVRPLLKNPE